MTSRTALLAMLLLSACGSASEREHSRQEERTSGGHELPADQEVRLALLRPGPIHTDLGLEGVLQVEGRCLYVAQPDSSAGRSLLVFPFPASWDAQRNLLLVGKKSFAPGQWVSLGRVAGDVDRRDWLQAPDPSCDSSSIFVTGSIEAARERPRPAVADGNPKLKSR